MTGNALLLRRGGRLSEARVSAPGNPRAGGLSGDGWSLELKPGWKVVPVGLTADYTIAREYQDAPPARRERRASLRG